MQALVLELIVSSFTVSGLVWGGEAGKRQLLVMRRGNRQTSTLRTTFRRLGDNLNTAGFSKISPLRVHSRGRDILNSDSKINVSKYKLPGA